MRSHGTSRVGGEFGSELPYRGIGQLVEWMKPGAFSKQTVAGDPGLDATAHLHISMTRDESVRKVVYMPSET